MTIEELKTKLTENLLAMLPKNMAQDVTREDAMANLAEALAEPIDEAVLDVQSYDWKGMASVAEICTMQSPQRGDVWGVTDGGTIVWPGAEPMEVEKGDIVVYNGSGWKMFLHIDPAVVDCYTKAETDERIAAAVNAEANARQAADNALSAAITAEATARANADTALGERIDSEASARESADNTLQGNIDAEASARESADDALDARIDGEETAREQADSELQAQIDAISSKSDVVDVVASYVELIAYDTSALGDNDVVKVLEDETHDDAESYYRWNLTTQTWGYIGSQGPFVTPSEMMTALNGKVDKVAGKGLSTNDYTTAEKNKLAGIETGATKTVVDSALSGTSTNPVQNKVVKAALDNKADSSLLAPSHILNPINSFTDDVHKGPTNVDFVNAYWALDKRYVVTLTRINADGTTTDLSGEASKLFNGNYDSFVQISANCALKIHIQGNPYIQASGRYPYGYYVLSFYYNYIPLTVSCRVYENYSSSPGWKNIGPKKIAMGVNEMYVFNSAQQYYNLSEIEITVTAKDSATCGVSSLMFCPSRGITESLPFVSKYGPQQLLYDLTAPNFVGNLDGKLKTPRNLKVNLTSTSAQPFDGSANAENIGIIGTLPITYGGTAATTPSDARNNLNVYSKGEVNTAMSAKADNTPTFSQASSRANLNGSGETMPTILGKIKKWFTDLKALAFKDKVSDSDINDTISDSHIASASTWNGKANADGSNATGTWDINIIGTAGYTQRTGLVSVRLLEDGDDLDTVVDMSYFFTFHDVMFVSWDFESTISHAPRSGEMFLVKIFGVGYDTSAYYPITIVQQAWGEDGSFFQRCKVGNTWSEWKEIALSDGSNASGTWNIDISGRAANATNATNAQYGLNGEFDIIGEIEDVSASLYLRKKDNSDSTYLLLNAYDGGRAQCRFVYADYHINVFECTTNGNTFNGRATTAKCPERAVCYLADDQWHKLVTIQSSLTDYFTHLGIVLNIACSNTGNVTEGNNACAVGKLFVSQRRNYNSVIANFSKRKEYVEFSSSEDTQGLTFGYEGAIVDNKLTLRIFVRNDGSLTNVHCSATVENIACSTTDSPSVTLHTTGDQRTEGATMIVCTNKVVALKNI